MPGADSLQIDIDGYKVAVTDPKELPVSITYQLESPDDFQQKTSAEGFDVELPAVLINDLAANGMRLPEVEDLTNGEVFKSARSAIISEGGYEILVGKAFLKSAKHNSKPISYTFNFYGDNADWIIDLQDKTLYDFLKQINFVFTDELVQASWLFDGTDETLPYVFAPVRYRYPPGGYTIDANNNSVAINDNFLTENMKPSISKFFIWYWALQSLGYQIVSNFFDQPYFRRQVMPWTWGNFLNSEGTKLDQHKFLAKSVADQQFDTGYGRNSGIRDLKVSNVSTDGAFDNNHDYSYDATTFTMKWQYNPPYFGLLDATFSMDIFYSVFASGNSESEIRVQWFKNGEQFDCGYGDYNNNGNLIVDKSSKLFGGREAGEGQQFATVRIDPTDNNGSGTIVTAQIYISMYQAKAGNAEAWANVVQFAIDYFRIPLGGTIDFQNYTGFQSYKVLDFMAGCLDEFDLSLNTDSANKIVYIEPTHPYSLDRYLLPNQPGYFKNDFIDWNGKEDLSKDWQMDNYADEMQQVTFSYKNDSADGILKLIQDRNINLLATAKYVFPTRFQTGTKARENRFFGPTMHYNLQAWQTLGTGDNEGIATQLVCIIPDNISSTSESESDNTFAPKSCYYKGLVTNAGAWVYNRQVNAAGTVTSDGIMQEYPFMFSVNYNPGGYNDPILSYCDEKIAVGSGDLLDENGDPILDENGNIIETEGNNVNGFVLGKGLLKRFFWQRLAIMRNGQYYTSTWFRLKNSDVAGQLHREFVSYRGQKWELIQINNYKPLVDDSTQCLLYKWSPVTVEDAAATYPSESYTLNGTTPPDGDSVDIKYAPLQCLITDVPST